MSNAIFSDDPKAIEKLREKISRLEQIQQLMKDANKIVKSKKIKDDEEKIKKLAELDITNPERLLKPNFGGEIGFPYYELRNNNANIKRLKGRLTQLESKIGQESNEIKFDDITVIKNVEYNRIQILFPGKPDKKVRSLLKYNGFKWSPNNGVWQRHNNNNGVWAANQVMKAILNEDKDTEIMKWW